jgi:hypothetical protein
MPKPEAVTAIEAQWFALCDRDVIPDDPSAPTNYPAASEYNAFADAAREAADKLYKAGDSHSGDSVGRLAYKAAMHAVFAETSPVFR